MRGEDSSEVVGVVMGKRVLQALGRMQALAIDAEESGTVGVQVAVFEFLAEKVQ